MPAIVINVIAAWSVRLSHLCTPLKQLDGMRWNARILALCTCNILEGDV